MAAASASCRRPRAPTSFPHRRWPVPSTAIWWRWRPCRPRAARAAHASRTRALRAPATSRPRGCCALSTARTTRSWAATRWPSPSAWWCPRMRAYPTTSSPCAPTIRTCRTARSCAFASPRSPRATPQQPAWWRRSSGGRATRGWAWTSSWRVASWRRRSRTVRSPRRAPPCWTRRARSRRATATCGSASRSPSTPPTPATSTTLCRWSPSFWRAARCPAACGSWTSAGRGPCAGGWGCISRTCRITCPGTRRSTWMRGGGRRACTWPTA